MSSLYVQTRGMEIGNKFELATAIHGAARHSDCLPASEDMKRTKA